jgi:hypothetical protein
MILRLISSENECVRMMQSFYVEMRRFIRYGAVRVVIPITDV